MTPEEADARARALAELAVIAKRLAEDFASVSRLIARLAAGEPSFRIAQTLLKIETEGVRSFSEAAGRIGGLLEPFYKDEKSAKARKAIRQFFRDAGTGPAVRLPDGGRP